MTDRAPLFASEAPPRAKITNYPEPFAARVGGRLKRPLGDLFGLRNFGVEPDPPGAGRRFFFASPALAAG